METRRLLARVFRWQFHVPLITSTSTRTPSRPYIAPYALDARGAPIPDSHICGDRVRESLGIIHPRGAQRRTPPPAAASARVRPRARLSRASPAPRSSWPAAAPGGESLLRARSSARSRARPRPPARPTAGRSPAPCRRPPARGTWPASQRAEAPAGAARAAASGSQAARAAAPLGWVAPPALVRVGKPGPCPFCRSAWAAGAEAAAEGARSCQQRAAAAKAPAATARLSAGTTRAAPARYAQAGPHSALRPHSPPPGTA